MKITPHSYFRYCFITMKNASNMESRVFEPKSFTMDGDLADLLYNNIYYILYIICCILYMYNILNIYIIY